MFRSFLILSLFFSFTSAHAEDMVEFVINEHFKSISDTADILIVMDKSMSMSFFMKDIPSRWDHFLTPLEENKIDFQVGLIDSSTTDSGEKSLILMKNEEHTINNYSDNPNQILIDFLQSQKCTSFPFCGNGKERALGSLIQYLKTQNDDGLIRKYTDKLFVLVFTDSNEYDKKKVDSPATAEEVIDVFGRYFPKKELIVHTFTVTEDVCKDRFTKGLILSLFGEGFTARDSMELSESTGGDVFSLCLENYQEASQKILDKVRLVRN